jgi:hypothetical protein
LLQSFTYYFIQNSMLHLMIDNSALFWSVGIKPVTQSHRNTLSCMYPYIYIYRHKVRKELILYICTFWKYCPFTETQVLLFCIFIVQYTERTLYSNFAFPMSPMKALLHNARTGRCMHATNITNTTQTTNRLDMMNEWDRDWSTQMGGVNTRSAISAPILCMCAGASSLDHRAVCLIHASHAYISHCIASSSSHRIIHPSIQTWQGHHGGFSLAFAPRWW